MSTLEIILTAIVYVLVVYLLYRWWSGGSGGSGGSSRSEGFGPCSDCDVYRDRIFTDSDIMQQNPYRWPASGTAVYNQWMFSPGGVQPPNSTDAAEALAPPNVSGMNQLTVPDQEYRTN